MDTSSSLERQQAVDYVKARVARLSERKTHLEMNYQGPEGHLSAQMELIDYKIDRLLDRLTKIKNSEAKSAGFVQM